MTTPKKCGVSALLSSLLSDAYGRVCAAEGDARGMWRGTLGRRKALMDSFNASNASATVRWWDPREGVYLNESSAAPVISLSGRQAFVPPTNGSVDDDWVLHVKAA